MASGEFSSSTATTVLIEEHGNLFARAQGTTSSLSSSSQVRASKDVYATRREDEREGGEAEKGCAVQNCDYAMRVRLCESLSSFYRVARCGKLKKEENAVERSAM